MLPQYTRGIYVLCAYTMIETKCDVYHSVTSKPRCIMQDGTFNFTLFTITWCTTGLVNTMRFTLLYYTLVYFPSDSL